MELFAWLCSISLLNVVKNGCVFVTLCLIFFVVLQLVLSLLPTTLCTGQNPTHLFVIHHGHMAPYIGTYPLLRKIRKLAEKNGAKGSNYIIHITRVNSNHYLSGLYLTNDGIDRGGVRLANDIKSLIDTYPSIDKISLIGGSLGGLYNRYAIAKLFNRRNRMFYNNIRPINFVSLASPHLGVDDWVSQKWYLYKLALFLRHCCGGRINLLPPTITQLLRLDKKRLLHRMATNDEFIIPLQYFRNPILYANALSDNSVSYSSAAILSNYGLMDIPATATLRATQSQSLINAATVAATALKSLPHSRSEPSLLSVNRYLRNFAVAMTLQQSESVILEMNGHTGDTNDKCVDIRNSVLWYERLQKDIDWKRCVCVMQQRAIDRWCAHYLLANPLHFYRGCEPVLNHINRNLIW